MKQRIMFQTNKQNKTQKKNQVKIRNSHNKEFTVMMRKQFQELRRKIDEHSKS